MAKQIWRVCLPNISEAGVAIEKVLLGTAQQQKLRDSIATATEQILNWLGMLAKSIQEHKATDTYKEHARKSGTQKNQSGLNDIELREKQEKKRVARLKYGPQPSTASRTDTWQAAAQWQWYGNTWQPPAQWQWRGDPWQAHAQWRWHGDTGQPPAQWQGHGDPWQAHAQWR